MTTPIQPTGPLIRYRIDNRHSFLYPSVDSDNTIYTDLSFWRIRAIQRKLNNYANHWGLGAHFRGASYVETKSALIRLNVPRMLRTKVKFLNKADYLCLGNPQLDEEDECMIIDNLLIPLC